MGDLNHDRRNRAVLYDERLHGLRYDSCSLCGEWEDSTGWLLYSEDAGPYRWYIEFKCAGCGSQGGVWKREWQSLIDKVLEAQANWQDKTIDGAV